MSAIPTSLTALLTRKQGAAALTEYGYKTAESTLDTVASRGGGPVYRLYGGPCTNGGPSRVGEIPTAPEASNGSRRTRSRKGLRARPPTPSRTSGSAPRPPRGEPRALPGNPIVRETGDHALPRYFYLWSKPIWAIARRRPGILYVPHCRSLSGGTTPAAAVDNRRPRTVAFVRLFFVPP